MRGGRLLLLHTMPLQGGASTATSNATDGEQRAKHHHRPVAETVNATLPYKTRHHPMQMTKMPLMK